MIYLVLALIVATLALLIYKNFHKAAPKTILLQLGAVGAALFFTYIAKVIFIHKPTFIVHLGFLLLSWYGVFLFLIKQRFNAWLIFAPLATTLFFVLMALFFRENA